MTLPPPHPSQSWLTTPTSTVWHYRLFADGVVHTDTLYHDVNTAAVLMLNDWNEYNPVQIPLPAEVQAPPSTTSLRMLINGITTQERKLYRSLRTNDGFTRFEANLIFLGVLIGHGRSHLCSFVPEGP